jgi:hypothetical protein
MPILRNEMQVYSRNQGLKYRASYNSSSQVEYEGWAHQNDAAEGDLSWQIIKHTYTDGNLTASNWASSTDQFIHSWTLKATYTYA